MSAPQALSSAGVVQGGASPVRLAQVPRLLLRRARSPVFWRVQAMVGLITILHFMLEAPYHGPPFEHLHHLPPILYVFPIIYASFCFRLEGGLLTGLWASALSVPNMVLWHHASFEWGVELAQLGTSVVVGVVLARLVAHEANARRRAEGMASRLALVNRQITRAQEDERRRIARELHDDTAQSLILLSRRLDGVLDTPLLADDVRLPLRDLRAQVGTIVADVRRFGRDLRPSVLDDLGLAAAIEWLTEELSGRFSIVARAQILGPQRRLEPEAELALFRIAQEALRNVERHAAASEVTVRLEFAGDCVRLSVRDNGRGFALPTSQNDLVASGRLGLAGMQERAQLVGAELALQTQLGIGTSITVTLAC